MSLARLIPETECAKGGNLSRILALKLKRGVLLRSLLSLALAIALGAIDACGSKIQSGGQRRRADP